MPENQEQVEQDLPIPDTQTLAAYLIQCRWFGGKARKLQAVSIHKRIQVTSPEGTAWLLFLKVKYISGKSDQYLLPVAITSAIENIPVKGIIAPAGAKWWIDAIYSDAFRRRIFHSLEHAEKIKTAGGTIHFERGSALQALPEPVVSRVLDAEQSNSSIIYDEKYFLKIYRKLFREKNPDVEMVQYLTEQAHFRYIPAYAGSFYVKQGSSSAITLGMMQQKVSGIKDAWSVAGDYLTEYVTSAEAGKPEVPASSLDHATLIGQRTAELHVALSSETRHQDFIAEPFHAGYTQWVLTNCENLLKRRLRLAKDGYASLNETCRAGVRYFLQEQQTIRNYFEEMSRRSFVSKRIRIHGDYHLGQVLFDGHEYIILDFEGEPEGSISDRKIKHSPLKDVAGMLRSFHYAVCAKLLFNSPEFAAGEENLHAAVETWYQAVNKVFLQAYWSGMQSAGVLDAGRDELRFLLNFHLLEKAVYELGYELNSRPAWVQIPLQGIRQVMSQMT